MKKLFIISICSILLVFNCFEAGYAFDLSYIEELNNQNKLKEMQQYLDQTNFDSLKNIEKQEYFLKLALLKIVAGKFSDALNCSDQADKFNPEGNVRNKVRANLFRAVVYNINQQTDKTIPILDNSEKVCIANNLDEELGDIYSIKGYILMLLAKNIESLDFYNKAAEIYKKSNKLKKYLDVQINIASSLISMTKLNEAETKLDKIKEDNTGLNNQFIEAKRNLNLTIINYSRGQFDKALNSINIAINYAESNDEKMLLAESNLWKAMTISAMGQDDEALPLYLKSIAYFKETFGDKHFLSGLGYFYLSGIYYKKADYNQSLIMANKAYDIFEKIYGPLHPFTANSLNQVAQVNNKLGNYDKAITLYKKSIENMEKVYGKDSFNNISAYNNLASVYYNQSKYFEALELFKKSLYLMDKFAPENNPFYSKIYDNIAVCLLNLNNYQEALLYQQKALNSYLKESSKGENSLPVAISYSHLANIYLNLHQFDNMRDAAFKSVDIIENNNLTNNPSAAFVYDQLSSLFNLTEFYEESLDCLEKALLIRKKYLPKNHREIANTYNLIGNTFDNLKDYKRALMFYLKATEIFRDNNDLYYLWQGYSNLGYTNQKQKNYKEALNYYDKTLAVLDLIIKNSSIKDDKYSLSKQRRLIIENAIKSSVESNSLFKALFYSDKGRYQDLIGDLTFKKARMSIVLSKDDNIKLEELQAILTKYEKLCPGNTIDIKNIQSKGLNSLVANYDANCQEKNNTRRALDDFMATIYKKYPELNRKSNDILPTEAKLKTLLEKPEYKNKAIIEYWVGYGNLYTFLVFKGKVTVIKTDIYFDEVEKLVKDYNKPFRLVSLANTTGLMLNILKKYDTKTSYKLYQLLLEPALTKLKTYESFNKDTNIIIIPNESLSYLSFETLITSETTNLKENGDIALSEYENLPYLIKEYNISYLPNIALSEFIKPFQPIEKEVKDNLLIIGNPDIIHTKENDPSLNILGELPFSEKEAELIHEIFKDNSELITGHYATEKNIVAKLGKYRNYHFACHGIINEEEPLKSGIVLGKDLLQSQSDIDEGYDGLLRTYEIIMKNINANLVVLSACESGVGKLNSGEGVLGIARSFLASGANAIIISLWKINDESSSVLMRDFYTNISKLHSESASNALKESKLNLMKTDNKDFICGKYKGMSFSHPYFWGAFIYTGI